MADGEFVRSVRGNPGLLAESPGALEVARMMQGLNALATLHRALYNALDNPYEDRFGRLTTQGDQIVLLANIVGLLKESADAFRQASSTLKAAARSRDQALLDRLRQMDAQLDQATESSFYNQVLKPARDDIAFHWRRSRVEQVLASRQGAKDAIFTMTFTTTNDSEPRFTLIDAVAAEILFGTRDRNEIRDRIEAIQAFSMEFLSVGFEVISLWLLAKGLGYETNGPDKGSEGGSE